MTTKGQHAPTADAIACVGTREPAGARTIPATGGYTIIVNSAGELTLYYPCVGPGIIATGGGSGGSSAGGAGGSSGFSRVVPGPTSPAGVFWHRTGGKTHCVTIRRETVAIALTDQKNPTAQPTP